MKICNRNKALGSLAIVGNSFILFRSIYLLYCYSFTSKIFLFKYPNWILFKDALLGFIGIYISILLYKDIIRLNSFLVMLLLIWLLCFLY